MFFHTHIFHPEKGILFCRCGSTKNIPHEHIWEDKGEVSILVGSKEAQQTLLQQQCKTCGARQAFNLVVGKYQHD